MIRATLLRVLQCPRCGGEFRSGAEELTCQACAHRVPVHEGIPRFIGDTTNTAVYFGYMWGAQEERAQPITKPIAYHLSTMHAALGSPTLEGLILDAGCGEGIDLASAALDPRCEVIGVELSTGGVATSAARTRGLERAHIVQADLLGLPIISGVFDGAYSYGVVHHTPNPPLAIQEIARTLKPGAPLLFYVYEDFSDRAWYWRLALTAVNSMRVVTTRMPPALLMVLCRVLSPVVYVLLTIPSRHFRWAARFPYRHGTHAWSMVGDLFDRLSAPIEKRYSRAGAAALAESAGLEVVAVAQERGWMVHGRKVEELKS
ncbi:MAG: methyltransferase domain-containing protein [Vicinamibacterales bacterium]